MRFCFIFAILTPWAFFIPFENTCLAQAKRENWEKLEIKAFKGKVKKIFFSKDGQIIYSLGNDTRLMNHETNTLIAWNTATGEKLFKKDGISKISLSNDTKMIATWGNFESTTGQVKILDATNGEELFSLGNHNTIGLEFSPTGKKLLGNVYSDVFLNTNRTMKIWDLNKKGKEIKSLEGAGIFSIDGKTIIFNTPESESLEILDSVTLEKIPSPRRVHSGKDVWLTKSLDGKKVVSVSQTNDNSSLKVWDFTPTNDVVEECKELVSFMEPFKIGELTFSPDGKRIATHGLKTKSQLNIWDITSGKKITTQNVNDSLLSKSIAFSPTDEKIAFGSVFSLQKDFRDHLISNTLTLYDAKKGNSTEFFANKTKTSINLTDSSRLAIPLAFSPNGKLLASYNYTKYDFKNEEDQNPIKLWNADSGEKIFSFDGHGTQVHSLRGDLRNMNQSEENVVSVFAFTPDGTMLASGSRDGSIKLWDISPKKEANNAKKYNFKELSIFDEHKEQVTATDLSSDGKQIASGDLNGIISVWDSQNLKVNLSFQAYSAYVTNLTFSPDGTKILTNGFEGNREKGRLTPVLKLWNSSNGILLDSLTYKNGDTVGPLAFSPDGTKYATVGLDFINDRYDRLIKIRDFTNKTKFGGESLRIPFDDNASYISFSPDRSKLFTGNPYKVNLWDSITGRRIGFLETRIRGHQFSPDGKKLLLWSVNKGIAVYDTENFTRLFITNEFSSPKAAAFSNDGKFILVVNVEDSIEEKNPLYIKVWNATTGELVSEANPDGPYKHASSLQFLRFNDKGDRILSWGSSDRDAYIFEIPCDILPKSARGNPSQTATSKTEPSPQFSNPQPNSDMKILDNWFRLKFSGDLKNNFGRFNFSFYINTDPKKRDTVIDSLGPYYTVPMTIVWESGASQRTSTHEVNLVVGKDSYKIKGMQQFFRGNLSIQDFEGPIIYENGSIVLSNKLVKFTSSKY